MTCREVYFDQTLYYPGDEIKHFYLIKSGEVRFFDQNYDYMYNLQSGSFFGDVENIFGLYSACLIKTTVPEKDALVYK